MYHTLFHYICYGELITRQYFHYDRFSQTCNTRITSPFFLYKILGRHLFSFLPYPRSGEIWIWECFSPCKWLLRCHKSNSHLHLVALLRLYVYIVQHYFSSINMKIAFLQKYLVQKCTKYDIFSSMEVMGCLLLVKECKPEEKN